MKKRLIKPKGVKIDLKSLTAGMKVDIVQYKDDLYAKKMFELYAVTKDVTIGSLEPSTTKGETWVNTDKGVYAYREHVHGIGGPNFSFHAVKAGKK